jgi:Secretion system C-terminal sorting domain/SprB repeat
MKTPKRHLLKLLLSLLLALGWYVSDAQTLYVADSTTSSCNNDGQVHVIVSGGTAPYTYTLASYYTSTTFNQITQTSPNFLNIPQGYYLITVADANGLNNATQPTYAYVGSRFYPYVNITPAVCPATTGSETANVYNVTGPFSYLWSNGATTQTITNVPAGSHYICTVTDQSSGCSAATYDSTGMYQVSSITATINTTVANCSNGTATAVAANGVSPYTYLWSNGQSTATATGMSAGYPSVTVTDAQGCSAQFYASVNQGLVISTQTNTTAEHCNDGNGTASITPLNGSAPFNYVWSSGNTTPLITGLSEGYYSVTLTDHNGCTASSSVFVQKSSPIVLSTSSTNTLCTSNTGTATVVATGGTAPYIYVWNSYPIQTTSTATALGAGYYIVEVTDAVGCRQNQSATVSNNTTLYLSLSKTNAVCGGAAGSVDANISGGNTPYSQLWSNGATTTNISGIHQAGSYAVTVTDAVGCKVSQYTYVESVSPIMIVLNANNASCIYTADGTASISALGGLAPYTYHWPNGQTTATANGFLPGDYYVYVSDANGCTSGHFFTIGYNSVLPCAVTISGMVYDDHNGNCAVDATDAGLNGVWVGCFPNGSYQWTNYSGYYNFILPPGTYDLAQTPPLYHSVICPAIPPTVTLTAGQSSPNYNFFNQPDSINDLAINCIPYQEPVAGFTQHLKMFVRNLGTFAQTPDVVYMHSTDINFLSSTPAPDTYDPATGKLTWYGPGLNANGVNVIDLYFDIPAALPTGHILNNSDTVYPIVGDTSSYNNFEDVQGLVVRSLDPNYIDVLPKGTGTPGYISAHKDSILRYVVHFQNTGNHAATYVTLKIPIDTNLDISKFKFIGASHAVTSISADNNRILTIRFDYINLPDSGTNRLGSQGFAAFTFNQKAGLVPLNTITEQANIYFDFNTPVPTNHVLNTISPANGINTIEADDLKVYPNPTAGKVTVDLSAVNETMKKITVYDMTGRAVIEMPISDSSTKRFTINMSSLGAGIYVIEATGESKYIQKITKTE